MTPATPFGKEQTAAECRERAAWERHQADIVRAAPYGPLLAAAHERVAAAYETLAREKETTHALR